MVLLKLNFKMLSGFNIFFPINIFHVLTILIFFLFCLNLSVFASQNENNDSFILKNYTDTVFNFIDNFSLIVKKLKLSKVIDVKNFSNMLFQIIPKNYKQQVKTIDENNKNYIKKAKKSFENELKNLEQILELGEIKGIKGSVDQLNHLIGVGPTLFHQINDQTLKITSHSISILTKKM